MGKREVRYGEHQRLFNNEAIFEQNMKKKVKNHFVMNSISVVVSCFNLLRLGKFCSHTHPLMHNIVSACLISFILSLFGALLEHLYAQPLRNWFSGASSSQM